MSTTKNNYNTTESTKNKDIYYVYVYLHPITWLPFYIGKGSKERIYHHLKPINLKQNSHKNNKIKSIQKKFNCDPIIIKLKENMSESSAYELEDNLIRHYGRTVDGGLLTNICFGAKPPNMKGIKRNFAPTHRKNLSISQKGKVLSEEHKNKISQTLLKNSTPERRYKNGSANRGKKLSKETKAKMSAYQKGRPKSESHKQAMRKPKSTTINMKQQKITCPHCGLHGGVINLKRYHFNNCKSLIT